MRFRYLLLVVLATGALSAQTVPAKPADIAGVWEFTMQTPQSDMTSDATFVQDGDRFKFTMTGPQGMELAGEGTIKGKDLEWTVLLSGGMGEMTLIYKGKLDGETMTGEVQAGDFGAFPFTAKKKK